MRHILFVLMVIGLLFSACQGQKSGDTEEGETADSTQQADTTAMTLDEEVAAEDSPMPKAADEMFDDFIFNFAANKKLQSSRIKFPLKVQRGDEVSYTKRTMANGVFLYEARLLHLVV